VELRDALIGKKGKKKRLKMKRSEGSLEDANAVVGSLGFPKRYQTP
jgi:hypothetical protein